jgi:predicted metalloprotease
VAGRWWQRGRAVVSLVLAAGLAGGCARVVDGSGSIGLTVQGDSGSAFDTQAKTALSAVLSYWAATYPSVAKGAALPPLRGKLYSIDGAEVVRTHQGPASASDEKCLQKRLGFIIDNAAYCQLDDSIVWDRAPNHLLPVLADTYGSAVTALVFAHEFGHAVQHRLQATHPDERTIDVESQADCAAGAFAAAALDGRTGPLHLTSAELDRALVGYLQIRDSTPDSPADISHGDGFDRLNSVQQGIQDGATHCFDPAFLTNRTYTERGYVHDDDYTQGGNQPLPDVLDPDQLVADLNRFWTATAETAGKTFAPVKLVQAAHPACGAVTASSEFGYCPDDNSVYYSAGFAQQAYYSITVPAVDSTSGAVQLQQNQPGDFALGTLMAVGWGMAARHQILGRSTADRDALTAAICDAGAYAEDVNRADYDATHKFILSPPDMDEATSAVLSLVGLDQAFSARGTSGLQRVQAFVKGYTGGFTRC